MNLIDRINVFENLFDDLQSTNSRLDKQAIVEDFRVNWPNLQWEWKLILEVLEGMHPLHYTFIDYQIDSHYEVEPEKENWKLGDVITSLYDCKILTKENIESICYDWKGIGHFLAPIMNRKLRLGIGRSLLDKSILSPMLAKKYDGKELDTEVFVTEKLDGNRCIAYYNGLAWTFTSRSGKPLNVQFHMGNLPKCYIYDGEVMSDIQTEMSNDRYNGVAAVIDEKDAVKMQQMFNKTSGMINRKSTDKNLKYTIFDIISDEPYKFRRITLDKGVKPYETEDVRVLPVLSFTKDPEKIDALLEYITDRGGEGIMLNDQNADYEHKRTGALLKYKKIQTIDMRVINIFEGKGKYENCCGGLICNALTDDGRNIVCEVGSGLSDAQRILWYNKPQEIINKIVEVAYHELTQDRFSIGTKSYSLRFPRLKSVRTDKSKTSEY